MKNILKILQNRKCLISYLVLLRNGLILACMYPSKGYFLPRKMVSFECQTTKMTFSDIALVANYKKNCIVLRYLAISNKTSISIINKHFFEVTNKMCWSSIFKERLQVAFSNTIFKKHLQKAFSSSFFIHRLQEASSSTSLSSVIKERPHAASSCSVCSVFKPLTL